MSETQKAAESAAAAQQKLGSAELVSALRSAEIGVLRQGTDLRYSAAVNLPPVLADKWRPGCAEEELFAPALAAQLRCAKQRLLAGKSRQNDAPERLEARLPVSAGKAKQPPMAAMSEAAALQAEAEAARAAMAAPPRQSSSLPFFGYYAPAQAAGAGAAGRAGAGGGAGAAAPFVWLRFSLTAQRDDRGQIIGIITAAEDITELRSREELLDVLLREVSHRSKNLLAIIQSIAAQTARFSRSAGVFLRKFQGRLQSLSSSQDLLTESDWRGARLRDLITAQMHLYAPADEGVQAEVKGENPYLFPSAALHIGLALHELAVNSASYGALAAGAGSIALDCTPAEIAAELSAEGEAGPRPGLRLRWREEFAAAGAGPAETAPNEPASAKAAANAAAADWPARFCRPGAGNDNGPEARARFGSIVLERIVPSALNGCAEYHIKNNMVEYILEFPLENYAED